MERYIEQLIEDIRNSSEKAPKEDTGTDDPDGTDSIRYAEQFVHGEAQPLSQITGIDQEQLPPVDKLNNKQINQLLNELIRLLNNFHFVPDFPEKVPVNLRYKVLREHWNDEYVSVGGGQVHIEFCILTY